MLVAVAGVKPCTGIDKYDHDNPQAQAGHDHLIRAALREGPPPAGGVAVGAGFLRGRTASHVSATLAFIDHRGRFWSKNCCRVAGQPRGRPAGPPGCCHECRAYYTKTFLPRCLTEGSTEWQWSTRNDHLNTVKKVSLCSLPWNTDGTYAIAVRSMTIIPACVFASGVHVVLPNSLLTQCCRRAANCYLTTPPPKAWDVTSDYPSRARNCCSLRL